MKRGKGWYWPWLIGGVMALVIGANLVLIYVATSDPSFAVEENYYQKGLDWDLERAQRQHNAELGWTLDLELGRSRAIDGTVDLTARLLDRDGQPIDDAEVRLETFHNARASHILRAQLRGRGAGSYTAVLPLRRPGIWEFRFEVTRGDERFTRTITKELAWR